MRESLYVRIASWVKRKLQCNYCKQVGHTATRCLKCQTKEKNKDNDKSVPLYSCLTDGIPDLLETYSHSFFLDNFHPM